MSTSAQPKASRERVRKHREKLRAQGLRPIQIWVPDVNSKAFREQAHRQALAIANSEHEAEDQAFVDAMSEWNDPGSEHIYKYEWPDEK